MKKVVFFACTVAALMASAPYAANAANPGINEVQEINNEYTQLNLGMVSAAVVGSWDALMTAIDTEAGITSTDKEVLEEELNKVSTEVGYIRNYTTDSTYEPTVTRRNRVNTVFAKVNEVQKLYTLAKQKYTQITDYTNLVQDKKDQVAALQAVMGKAYLFEAATTQINKDLSEILNDGISNKTSLKTTGSNKVDCADVEGYLSDRAAEKITEKQDLDWSKVKTGLAAIQTRINAQQAAITKAENEYDDFTDLYDRVSNDYNAYVNLWYTYIAEFNNSEKEFYNISENGDDNQYHVLDQKLDDLVSDKNSTNLNDFTDFDQKLQDPSLDYNALTALYSAISEHEQSFWKLAETIKKAKNFYAQSKSMSDNLTQLLAATKTLWMVAAPSGEASETAKDAHKALGQKGENLLAAVVAAFNNATILTASEGDEGLKALVAAYDAEVYAYYQSQKAVNTGYYVEFREQINDLMSSINDLRYNMSEVFLSFEDNEAMEPYTAEGWESLRGEALQLCADELAKINEDVDKGLLAFDADVTAYQTEIQAIKDALDALRQNLDGVEMVYAMSSMNKAELDARVSALQEIVKTTLANSVCDDCNEEDETKLKSAANGLVTILSEINDEFYAGNLYNKEAGVNEPDPTKTSYQVIAEKIDAAETSIAEIKDLIVEHKMLQKQNEQLYNNLVKLIEKDFAALNAEVMDMEGADVFAKRSDYNEETGKDSWNSNYTVYCLNELAHAVEDLKSNIEDQSSHSGSHSIIDNIDDNYKAIQALKDKYADLKVAIERNNAAKKLMDEKFAEVFQAAKEAYDFWYEYYSDETLTDYINLTWYINYWMNREGDEYVNGTTLNDLQNYIEYYYSHGIAARDCSVDGLGEELTENYLNDYFNYYLAYLASDRNYLAYVEGINHLNEVKNAAENLYVGWCYKYNETHYTIDGVEVTIDPFVLEEFNDLKKELEVEYYYYPTVFSGEVGNQLNELQSTLNDAYQEYDAENYINIDERNTALGLHQQLNGVSAVLGMIEEDYNERFEAAHHLTNGKTIYSDQEYFTLGFFKKANEGNGNQAEEMFNWVEVVNTELIHALDNGRYSRTALYTDPEDFNSFTGWEYDKNEDGNLILDEYYLPYEVDVETLVHTTPYYTKANELSFNLVQSPAYPLVKTTLEAGPATIEFKEESIVCDEWTIKHPVTIDFEVAEPVVETPIDPEGEGGDSNKLVFRPQFPVDLTYTSKVLVATTDGGEQISFADAQFNVAAGQIEFNLPEGTSTVELPEGFFTFRTGENSIARSAAKVIAVGGTQTSIDALVAMGEKAQIFDLQGRRVSVETLVKGNTYVVNGVKTIVK